MWNKSELISCALLWRFQEQEKEAYQESAQTQVLISKEESPLPPLLSPDMSPKSDAHPTTPNNIKNKPPMPIPKTRSTKYNNDSQTYKICQVQRSVSTREFRRLDQRKHYKLHALDG